MRQMYSTHLPNFLIINKLAILPNKLKIYKRNLILRSSLRAEVASMNWSNILSSNDSDNVNTLFHSFYSAVVKVVDKHAPSFVQNYSERGFSVCPSLGLLLVLIKNSIKIKNKYKFYRNKLNHLQRVSKKMYYERILQWISKYF